MPSPGFRDAIRAFGSGGAIEQQGFDDERIRLEKARGVSADMDFKVQRAISSAFDTDKNRIQVKALEDLVAALGPDPTTAEKAFLSGLASDFNDLQKGKKSKTEFEALIDMLAQINAGGKVDTDLFNLRSSIARGGASVDAGDFDVPEQSRSNLDKTNRVTDVNGRLRDAVSGDLTFPNVIKDIPLPHDVRSRKIQSLVSQGLSPQESANIADGFTKFPLTADNVIDDSAPVPGPKPGQSLFELAEFATGPFSKLTEVIATGKSIFTGDLSPKERQVIEARQTITTSLQNLILALSINSRNPVAEQQRLEEQINIKPTLFDSPSALRARMNSIRGSLEIKLEQEIASSQNPVLSESSQNNSRTKATAIRNFLAIMGDTSNIPSESNNKSSSEIDAIDAEIAALEEELSIGVEQ